MSYTSSPPSSPTQHEAPTIIDLTGADVTLVSSDGARFNVVKSVLSIASPFFRSMFELPSSPSNTPKTLSEVPMVTENAHILEAILRYTLPIAPKHILLDVHEAVKLIDTARKFQLEGTELAILNDAALLIGSEPNPLKAWSYAIRCGSEVARQAAMIRYLKVEEADLVQVTEDAIEELDWASARVYYELTKWRQEAIANARLALKVDTLEECAAGRIVSPTSFKKVFKITVEAVNPFSYYETNFHVLAKTCATAAKLSTCTCAICQHDSPSRPIHLKQMAAAVKLVLDGATETSPYLPRSSGTRTGWT